jgi:tetratricopeptide (TPR) repeat protein
MPYQPDLYIRLGNAYEKQGKTEEAIAAYERAVKIDRDRLRVHKTLVDLYVEQYQGFHDRIYGGREWNPDVLENAEDSLKKVIGTYIEIRRLARPKDKQDFDVILRDSRARLGHLYLTSEKPEKAVEVLQKVLAENSNHIDSNFGIGLAYQELGNFEKAEYHLRKTIEISPDRLQAYDSLGFLYLMFEKPGKAVEILQQLLAKDPDRVEGNYGIGMAYQELGNFEKAEYHLRKAITLAPHHEDAHNALGYLFAENGTNLDEAVKLVKKALRKSPQNGAYLDSLGWTYYKQGKLNEALTELEKALDYMPESADVQDHLGDVYIKKGLTQKAVAMWQKAVQLEPDNMKIREKLRSALEE